MDDETARELRALRKLWAWTLERYHSGGGDIDGWDLLTEAETWGLVKLVPYVPAEHGELDAEPGEPIYRRTGLAKEAD